jgi:hypothetical protein
LKVKRKVRKKYLSLLSFQLLNNVGTEEETDGSKGLELMIMAPLQREKRRNMKFHQGRRKITRHFIPILWLSGS